VIANTARYTAELREISAHLDAPFFLPLFLPLSLSSSCTNVGCYSRTTTIREGRYDRSNVRSHMRLAEVSRHQMKTLSSPLVSVCCYKYLPTGSQYRNSASQRVQGRRRALPAYVHRRTVCVSATEIAVTIIMHKTAGEALPCQNIFIALPLPAPISLPSRTLFLHVDCGVSATSLLPFHTVITHLYIRRALCFREVREESRIFSFFCSLFPARSPSSPDLSPVRVPRASIHRTRAYSGTHLYFSSSNETNGSDIDKSNYTI